MWRSKQEVRITESLKEDGLITFSSSSPLKSSWSKDEIAFILINEVVLEEWLYSEAD